MQEYSFKIVYRNGLTNTNAVALSRLLSTPCAFTVSLPPCLAPELQQAQSQDPIISCVHHARSQSSDVPSDKTWNKPPLCRFKQLWKQLLIADATLHCKCSLGPLEPVVMVPVLPPSFQQGALRLSYDAPTAGYQG